MKINKYIKSLLLAFAGCVLIFTGCSNLSSPKNETFVLSGKLILPDAVPSSFLGKIESQKPSRAATAGLITNLSALSVEVSALPDSAGSDETKKITGSVNADGTYSVELNSKEGCTVTVSAKKDDVLVLSGKTYIKNVPVLFNRELNEIINLCPVSSDETADLQGNVNLPVYLDSGSDDVLNISENIDNIKLYCNWSVYYEAQSSLEKITAFINAANSSSDDGYSFSTSDEDNQLYETLINITDVPGGIYKLALTLKNQDEKIWQKEQVVCVFAGLTTDSWTEWGGIIESAIIDTPARSLVENPVILYDLDTKNLHLDFDNPTPGYYVFDQIQDGAGSEYGAVLAQGKTVTDFAIDTVTQKIYTLEKRAKSYYIVEYPSYAGYAEGKIVSEVTLSGSFVRMRAYNGSIYILTTYPKLIKISSSGEKYISETLSTILSSPTVFDVYEETGEATDGSAVVSYVYLACKSYNSSINGDYEFVCVKAKFEETSETSDDGFYKFSFSSLASATANPAAKSDSNANGLNIYGVTQTTDDDVHNIYNPEYLYLNDLIINPDDNSKVHLLIGCTFFNLDNNTQESRGGILTAKYSEGAGTGSEGSLSFVNYNGTSPSGDSNSDDYFVKIAGWYYDGTHPVAENDSGSTSSDSAYFYNPTRFVARKPDELVIVDEGAYSYSTDNLRDKSSINRINRVVTVSLSDFAITSSTNVNFGFETYLLQGSSSVNFFRSAYYRNASDYNNATDWNN